MPEIEIEPGLVLHYIDEGAPASPAVLLLHGLGATGESWRPQIRPLTDAGFRVVAPDARGFGGSSYPGRGTSVSAMAGDLARLLEGLGIARTQVVGISMGGTLALHLAVDRPRMADRLVLVNTFACLRPRSLEVWLYFALRLLVVHTVGLPRQAQMVAHRIFPREDQSELRQELIDQVLQADPRAYRATMRSLALLDLRDRLGEVRAPTLIITGERDTTVPEHTQRELEAGIPGARRIIIENAGHAVISDSPERFNTLLIEFLSGRADSQNP
jgi:pimeloyl-ACP methyl ester carboxylesterase